MLTDFCPQHANKKSKKNKSKSPPTATRTSCAKHNPRRGGHFQPHRKQTEPCEGQNSRPAGNKTLPAEASPPPQRNPPSNVRRKRPFPCRAAARWTSARLHPSRGDAVTQEDTIRIHILFLVRCIILWKCGRRHCLRLWTPYFFLDTGADFCMHLNERACVCVCGHSF